MPQSTTRVTVVLPCAENPFTNKSVAASFVLNGFGKTLGLVQVDELGTLETPIALTNTLNVGIVHDALVEYTLRRCEAEGIAVTSLNPVVCECNDASLNDIRERAVTREHVFAAIEAARADFAEGGVGCGKGTTCHGLKGGVGSASRVLEIEGERFTLGVLAQTNHGSLADLQIGGHPVGLEIDRRIREDAPDKGSCIVIVATDLPVSSRQLRRIVKRAGAGLARCGSIWGHGSGDVFVGFSTADRIPADAPAIQTMRILREEWPVRKPPRKPSSTRSSPPIPPPATPERCAVVYANSCRTRCVRNERSSMTLPKSRSDLSHKRKDSQPSWIRKYPAAASLSFYSLQPAKIRR